MSLFLIHFVSLRMALTDGSMRTNGHLQYQILTGGGMNEYGEVVASEQSWSDPIPCSIKTNSDTRKGMYEDGVFRHASFTVLIELAKFPHNRIKVERLGEELGEYDVIAVEPLTTVGRTQIIV